jgi:His-Xaa-Ser system radical SAM maturase HxsB
MAWSGDGEGKDIGVLNPMSRRFLEAEAFGGHPSSYSLLPFRFTRLDPEREILVNEAGEYLLAPTGTVLALVRRWIDTASDLYRTLHARHFVYDAESSPLLDVLATKYRTKRSFLEGFTKLHEFVTTLRCEQSCQYCQVSRQNADRPGYDMSEETAERALDLMFQSPASHFTLEFQGGEPLLNFELIRFIVPRAKERAARLNKGLSLVVATNLTSATEEMLHYFRDQKIDVSTSLDGPAFIHNANRPKPGGNSYETTVRSIERARDVLGREHVAALMTTSRLSLGYPKEIIDEYVRLGFRSIFLRPLRPYGFAVRTQAKVGYAPDRFLEFYQKGLAYIIELNRRGIEMAEIYAKILLTKILTPFPTWFVDLQSPAGAGIAFVVYNYDGDVYASDESRMLAEMKDTRFRLGNVHTDDYDTIFGGPRINSLVQSSVVESLPGCTDCAFQTYCGADPVYHYATQGDMVGHRPTSPFCRRNIAILRFLFSLLATEDPEIYRIFFAWIRECNLQELKAEAGA